MRDLITYAREIARVYETKLHPTEQSQHVLYGLVSEGGALTTQINQAEFHNEFVSAHEEVGRRGAIMHSVAFYCNSLGVPLHEILERNVEELRHRFPDGFTGQSPARRYEEAKTQLSEQPEDDEGQEQSEEQTEGE